MNINETNEWKVALGDRRCVFAPGVAKPINCYSIQRAAEIASIMNALPEVFAALNRIADGHDITMADARALCIRISTG